jgi:hypothetical protein
LLGILVFEDFGEELPSLVKPPLLHGSAKDAEQALTAYAIALARLHAETTHLQAEYTEIVRTAFPRANVPRRGKAGALPLGHGWIDRVAHNAPSLRGGTLPDREVMLIAQRLRRPGPWLALAHGDPCPDNVLSTSGGRAELIDFEFATPGYALLDAAYWRMGFPTCWCAGHVPREVSNCIDRAYRTILAESVPLAADDDVFQQESAFISVAWLPVVSLGCWNAQLGRT